MMFANHKFLKIKLQHFPNKTLNIKQKMLAFENPTEDISLSK